MKSVSIIILILFTAVSLSASLTVKYDSSLDPEFINTEKIKGNEYFNVYELNKTFKAVIKEDLLDQRINISMYGKQVIVLMNSQYLLFQNHAYSFTDPMISREGRNLLPISFIRNILPLLFKDEIRYEDDSLLAKTPIDFSLKTVVIDPGHGGKDPGAIGYTKKNYEKDVVLKIAKKLKTYLEKELGINVVLTRDKDEFMPLQSRTQLANRVNADHPAIERRPARELDPDSDLGRLPVTVSVGPLDAATRDAALDAGLACAAAMRREGLIHGAVLALDGHYRVAGPGLAEALPAAA